MTAAESRLVACRQFAQAKINLTLHVTGHRPDGYHELDSLVVFAGVGDVVSATPSDRLSLVIHGPEAGGLSTTDNLVLSAARAFGVNRGAALHLTKNLPVASGIGGGSADAAATLKSLSKLWGVSLPDKERVLALGADVPVCLNGSVARIRGIGEQITDVSTLPDGLGLLLVNPRAGLSTPSVFSRLTNRTNPPMPAIIPDFSDAAALGQWLRSQRNDLQGAAIETLPVIAKVLDAIRESEPLLARMSGSGATCFGLYATEAEANAAAEKMHDDHPHWWSVASRIEQHQAGV